MDKLAIYDSESSPGQKLEVYWDGVQLLCTCLHYKEYGTCKHIMDYDLAGGGAAEQVVDDSRSQNPQPKGAHPIEVDGTDAVEFEKPSTLELEPDVEQAVKDAARKMKGGA